MGEVLYKKLDMFTFICSLSQTAQMKDGRHGWVVLKDFWETLWKREVFLLC